MKFGKRLHRQLQDTLPAWRDKYLSYKHLKKRLKLISSESLSFTQSAHLFDFYVQPVSVPTSNVYANVSDPTRVEVQGDDVGSDRSPAGERGAGEAALISLHPSVNRSGARLGTTSSSGDGSQLSDCEVVSGPTIIWNLSAEEADFIDLLNAELHKLNSFFSEKEEEHVIRLQEIKGRLEQVKETIGSEGTASSESDWNEEMVMIRKDTVNLHGEMVLLENYSSLNYTGLVKILKKHDKRTGALLRMPFIQTVLEEPFFDTELLTQLVRECEAILQFLFPFSSTTPDTGYECGHGKPADERADAPPGINRSTVAALRTMREFWKGSSTYNMFSIPPFSQSEYEEGCCGSRHCFATIPVN